MDEVERKLNTAGHRTIRVHLRGIGFTRNTLIAQIRRMQNIDITEIADTTRVAYNGCRPRKSRM